jgi:hypothetical protein
LDVPEESESVGMFKAASSTLRNAGFEHYELSNYAKAGHKCRHNQVYWLGHSYYAFGVGAASFLAGRRISRPKTLTAWGRYVDSLEEAAARRPPDDGAQAEHRGSGGQHNAFSNYHANSVRMLCESSGHLRNAVNATQNTACCSHGDVLESVCSPDSTFRSAISRRTTPAMHNAGLQHHCDGLHDTIKCRLGNSPPSARLNKHRSFTMTSGMGHCLSTQDARCMCCARYMLPHLQM